MEIFLILEGWNSSGWIKRIEKGVSEVLSSALISFLVSLLSSLCCCGIWNCHLQYTSLRIRDEVTHPPIPLSSSYVPHRSQQVSSIWQTTLHALLGFPAFLVFSGLWGNEDGWEKEVGWPIFWKTKADWRASPGARGNPHGSCSLLSAVKDDCGCKDDCRNLWRECPTWGRTYLNKNI